MNTYSIEICKHIVNEENTPIIAKFGTNNVLEFSQYLTDALSYFESMVRFESAVDYVGLLIRVHNQDSVVYISRDSNGHVKTEGMV